MRFGLFIPQGWRFDLVDIDPADQWSTMRDFAAHIDREGSAWESIWVYDHFHTVPKPSPTEATHEAWTLMAAFAASTCERAASFAERASSSSCWLTARCAASGV